MKKIVEKFDSKFKNDYCKSNTINEKEYNDIERTTTESIPIKRRALKNDERKPIGLNNSESEQEPEFI